MLSRLHRRAEALDEACLRAWGYPRDHSVQQELLNALEWDSSFHPEHARPLIRDAFTQVIVCSKDLSNCIRSGADASSSALQSLTNTIEGLRQRLMTLMEVIEKRHVRPPIT
jgi:hypothetical protein